MGPTGTGFPLPSSIKIRIFPRRILSAYFALKITDQIIKADSSQCGKTMENPIFSHLPLLMFFSCFSLSACGKKPLGLWGPVEITPHQLFSGGLPVPILGPIRSTVCDSLNLFEGERREKTQKNATVLEGQIPMKSSYIYIHNVT